MNAILIRPIKPAILTDGGRQAPAFEVILAGVFPDADYPGGAVTLKLFARDFDPDGNQHQNPDEELATITGVVKRMSDSAQTFKYFHFTLDQVQSNEARPWNDAQAGIDADDSTRRFPSVGLAFSSDTSKAALKWFRLPRARSVFAFAAQPLPAPTYFEGDTWELELRLTVPAPANPLRSPVFAVGWNPRVVPNRFVGTPTSTYDWHAGNDVEFYNDANADAPGNTGYFHDVEAAITAAQKLIFIVDWSFHPEARLTPGNRTLQNCVGAHLINKASNGQVTVAILTWWHGFAPKDPPNDLCPSALDEMATTLQVAQNNVLWRGAVRKGVGLSHHQKFVVVDDGALAPARARLKVFYGGIDITQGRSDWPDHPILRDDANCVNFLNTLQNAGNNWGNGGPYDDWYNAEFASADYGLPAAEAPKIIVGAMGSPAVVEVHNHGFQAGDIVHISGAPQDPAIEGDRVVTEAAGNRAYKVDHFGIQELDGTPIASNGLHPGGGLVTRNMPRFPRQPWHDVHARLEGPIAWDFAREFVGRWMRVVGSPDADEGDTGDNGKNRVWNAFYNLFDRTAFVQQWEDHVRAADEPIPGALAPAPAPAPVVPARQPIFAGQLLHSFPSEHLGSPKLNDRWHPARQEMKWPLSASYDRGIQDSYIKAILHAERFIYIENQYFIGSGSKLNPSRDAVKNRVPEALVSRILQMIAANQKFHVYVILPQIPEGPAVFGRMNPLPAVRNLEWRTIAYMIRSIKAVHANWWEYLSFYFLLRNDLPGNMGPFVANPAIANEAIRRTANVIRNQRYMIYVHCKLMIVDDRYLILGSANINERSMAGDRDTEICVALWPGSNQTQVACENTIGGLRQSLLAEHTGNNVPAPANRPNSDGFRNALQALAQNNYAGLLAAAGAAAPRLSGHLVMFPFEVAANGRDWASPAWAAASNLNQYITDSINSGNDVNDRRHVDDFRNKYWTWQSNVPWCCSALPDKLIE